MDGRRASGCLVLGNLNQGHRYERLTICCAVGLSVLFRVSFKAGDGDLQAVVIDRDFIPSQ